MHSIGRRGFLGGAASAAALTLTSHVTAFGRTKRLRVFATLPPANLPDRLPPEWYRRKILQIQEQMDRRKLDALVLLNSHNVIYTTGYFHLSTERPLAVLIAKSGDPTLFVPGLETDQVKLWWVKDFEAYFDFPGPVNRVRWIFERVARRVPSGARIGVEEPTASRLREIKLGAPHAEIIDSGDLIEHLRWVKDENELNIMRRGMYFSDFYVQAWPRFCAKKRRRNRE